MGHVEPPVTLLSQGDEPSDQPRGPGGKGWGAISMTFCSTPAMEQIMVEDEDEDNRKCRVITRL